MLGTRGQLDVFGCHCPSVAWLPILEGKHEIVVSGPILTDKAVSQQMAVDLGSVALGRLIAPKANESR